MPLNLNQVHDFETMIRYFSEHLGWNIDLNSFENIDDLSYGFDAEDIGLKQEEFSKVKSLHQLKPLEENQLWGIFSIEFSGKNFEVTALRKVLSGLVSRRRNSNHPIWIKENLLFLCFWGEGINKKIGVAHFEDKVSGLPNIKIIYCSPSIEETTNLLHFESDLSKLSWPVNTNEIELWKDQWSAAFSTSYKQTINDSKTLTRELALLAKNVQQSIINVFEIETAYGYVHLLFEKFRKALIHDMTKEQFADMYAQTMVYGLFSARCMDTSQGHFNPADSIAQIPNTNPFLKNLMKECLSQNNSSISFDELNLNDIVDLLNNTDTEMIMNDFNRQTGLGKEDPVIYFYEGFLDVYEKKQKKRRGVYYTPQPVVNFIVKVVDEVLRKDFVIVEGLSDISTKLVIKKGRNKNNVVRHNVPTIQILDPATGTGTFLRQTILKIYNNFTNNNKNKSIAEIKELWNDYVPKFLLPRLNGFEIMMAPYAVAHMKLAMVLKETGYDFGVDERVKVFLTNSLENDESSVEFLSLWEDPLTVESVESSKAKSNSGINIILGNPPYSGESANKGIWIMKLIEDYKKEPGGIQKLQERNPKWINDDYVKFIRYAQSYVERSGAGIIGYINPHGFIDNPTFRGMRWNLLKTFDKIYILNLHGNSKKKENAPQGIIDENVFDIQQGVSINIFIKNNSKDPNDLGKVYYADLWGKRDAKFDFLNNSSLSQIDFQEVKTESPMYYMVPKNLEYRTEYYSGFSLSNLFIVNSVGIVTSNDAVLIDDSEESLIIKVSKHFGIDANVKYIKKINYRLFDIKYIYYDTKLIERARNKVMQHFYLGENLGLIFKLGNAEVNSASAFISRNMIDFRSWSRPGMQGGDYISPIYLYHDDGTISSNIRENIINNFQTIVPDVSPEMIIFYIYAVINSTEYRKKYKEFLKIDFPNVPYPKTKVAFDIHVELGQKLANVHLFNSNENLSNEYAYQGNSDDIVSNCHFLENRIYINDVQYIDCVSEEIWSYYIGGYQPVQKWLKDRSGRILSFVEKKYYLEIIRAIDRTISLVKSIDENMTIYSNLS